MIIRAAKTRSDPLYVALAAMAAVAIGVATALRPASAVVVAGAVVAGLAVVLVLRWPRAWLAASPILVLIASTKFRARDPFAALGGSVDAQIAFELGVYAFLGCIVLSVGLQGAASRRRPALAEVLLLTYVGLACLSTAWSPTASITAVRSGQLALLALLGLGASRALGPERAVSALTGALAAYVLVFATLGALLGSSVPAGLFETEGGISRFTWFAVHPGIAAFGAAAASVAILAHPLTAPTNPPVGLSRFRPWILLPPLLLVVVLTRARTELFALAGALAALVMLRYVRPHVALPLTIAALSLGALTVASANDATLWVQTAIADGAPLAEFLTRGQTLDELATLSGRTELWGEILPLVGERWAFGHGYLGSRAVLLERIPWASYAHNAFAQSLLDLGLVGAALLWAAFLATVFRAARGFVARQGGDRRRWGVTLGLLLLLLLGAVTGDSVAAAPGVQLLVLCFTIGAVWAPTADVWAPTADV